MKVLILTQWYPPEPALLIQELAQTLQEKGHDVEILTGFPNYPSGNIYPGYNIRWCLRETLAGIHVIRVALYPDHSNSKAKRVLNYFSFAFFSALLGPFLVSRPDVIFVYHPPLTIGLPAFVLSRVWRVPFVYQIQDMWPETLSATGMVKNQRILKVVGIMAKWAYKKAKSILVISPGFKRNLVEKGVPAEKIHVVSNWIDPNLYHPEEPDETLAEQLGLSEKFNIMFAGNMGKAQGLEAVIEAADLIKDNKEIQFVFVGDGVVAPDLKKKTKRKKLQNIIFLGRFPTEKMSKLYALADVLLVHLNDDPLFRITIPHKILSYLGAGKPVLAALSGDGANIVAKEGAGIVCEPQNPEAIAEAIMLLYNFTQEERDALGKRAWYAAHTKYSREILVAEIEKVLLRAANPST